ncbi:sensor histidine kinase [Spirosoma endophyticum]|uniref:Histidine kinase-, DNA gyrase B-, and HSP90-like ATPase n=1 Tax=Spirosoma endophyticum TaxID=662367 RepID=A0A1I1Z7V3_9BACT|nr:histidine kinase [Spirosoma endophyticum]SFE27821.1 Histidine kinase-, DNA gyrase B-, and HSP90-like ATPase [Spirosoma endophyticum]
MNWYRITHLGITYRQIVLVAVLYGVSILLYDGAITISGRIWSKQSALADFITGVPRILVDYGVKLTFTIPIWYLLFVRLRRWPLIKRVSLHFVLLPLFVVIWQGICYAISDTLKIGRLRGDAQIWDTYISALFYLVQFGVFHAYAYHRDLQRQYMLEAELRQLALQSELSALKAQLNPHFLYNVFNTISASVPPTQERTRELLAELADLFRYQLQASRRDLVPVRDELAFVRKYLHLEKARFGKRLQVTVQVGAGVLDYLMPPMLLQPLVENSVRHGIAPLIEGGEVCIRIERRQEHLHLEVLDTGVGMSGSEANSQGVGLANTRMRLFKTYGSTLQLTVNQPRGVQIAFDIPLIEPPSAECPREGRSVLLTT